MKYIKNLKGQTEQQASQWIDSIYDTLNYWDCLVILYGNGNGTITYYQKTPVG